jgi:hypothetical protein
MLDEKLIKVLAKIYQEKNKTEWDNQKMVGSFTVPAAMAEKDRALLQQSDFKINDIAHHQHDEAVAKLKQIAALPHIEKLVFNLFIEAIGTGNRHGLQPIFSYLFAKHIPAHIYSSYTNDKLRFNNNERPCRICGIMHNEWRNNSQDLYHFYIGNHATHASFGLQIGLNEAQAFCNKAASKSSIAIFNQLIDFIEKSEQNDTPTVLLDRLSKAKILPKSNSMTRVILLRILAQLGILPNKFEANFSLANQFVSYSQTMAWELQLHDEAPNMHSEVNFPISAWRGNLGVNRKIAQEILQNL